MGLKSLSDDNVLTIEVIRVTLNNRYENIRTKLKKRKEKKRPELHMGNSMKEGAANVVSIAISQLTPNVPKVKKEKRKVKKKRKKKMNVKGGVFMGIAFTVIRKTT